MSALFSLSSRPPLPPSHSFILRGCHSSIKATNGTRKTFNERIVVGSLFLLKALELGFLFLPGLQLESAASLVFVVALSKDYRGIFVLLSTCMSPL